MFRKMDSTSPLYRLYYDFYIFQNENEEQADLFASTMESLFTSIGKHNITTLCMNLDDGIGDYVSQIYFIEKLNHLFQTVQNVKLKNISFVSKKKQPIAKIIRDKKVLEEDVLVLNETTNNVDIAEKTNLIGIPTKEQKTVIEKVLQDSDFIFNLALFLGIDSSSFDLARGYQFKPCKFDFKLPKQNAMITSWSQYDFSIYPSTNEQNHNYSGPIFLESSMGIKPGNVGIRFIDSEGVDKGDTLKLFSKEISERLLPNVDSEVGNEDYIKHNSFAGGYLQKNEDTLKFALFACQTTLKQGDMNLLVNTSHFDHYIQYDPDFLKKVALAGFTHIELPDRVIPLSEDSRQQNKRILRLFEFKGISEEDKARFYRLSEIVAASGDTSLSETISSALVGNNQPLPFLRGWHTGSGPVNSILNELPYEIKSHSELKPKPGNVYLESILSSNEVRYMVVLADGTRHKGVIEKNEPEFPKLFYKHKWLLPDESKKLLEYLSKKINLNVANFEVCYRDIPMNWRTAYVECTDSGLSCVFYSQKGKTIKDIISWDDLPTSFPRNTSAIFEEKNSYFPLIINALVKKNHLPQYKIFEMENKESIENYYKLAKYLELETIPSEEDIKFVRENRMAIASAWRSFCHYLNKTRNEKNYFNQLMVTYTFHHLLKNNCIEQVITLAKIIKPDSLSEPLLHMAIRFNNLEAVAAILDANLGDINQPHPANGYTPLHFAIHYVVNNSDMVKLLIERKADLTRLNLEDSSPLVFARRKGAYSSNNKVLDNLIEDLEIATRLVSEVVEVAPEIVIAPPPLVEKPKPLQGLLKTKNLSNEERAIRNRVILECCKEIDRLEPESTRNPFSTLFFLSYDYSDTKINAYKTIIQAIKSKPEMSIKTILCEEHLKKLLVRKDGDLIDGMGVINRDKKTKEFYNVYDALTSRRFFIKSKSEDKLAELQNLVSSDYLGRQRTNPSS